MEHRRKPSVLDLMLGSRATPAPSIARCLAASSSSSRFFRSSSVSPTPFIIASATFLSLASSALDFFVSSFSAGGAVYAPSSIRNVRVNASKDSHPAEAPFASNLKLYRASSLDLLFPPRSSAVRASSASVSPSHSATTWTAPSSVPASASLGDGA